MNLTGACCTRLTTTIKTDTILLARNLVFRHKLVKKTAMAWHGLRVEPLLGF